MTDVTLGGQVGIITGGGGGIGAATALNLASAQARLMVVDRSATDAAAVAERIRTDGGDAIAFPADVTRYDDLVRAHDRCLETFGRLDFAVLSAGIVDASTLADGDPDRWRAVIETNVLGVAYSIRAILATLQRQRSGHIVLIASLSGRDVYVGEPIYLASKWAVVGLGHALRMEAMPFGVRVTLIEPGLVDTPLSRSSPVAQQSRATTVPLTPGDVARAITFVLSQPEHVAISELVVRPSTHTA